MKTYLLLPNLILVSDEQATVNEWAFYSGEVTKKLMPSTWTTEDMKILAGIPELPTIDFSELSEADAKKIGYVDVEKEVESLYYNFKLRPMEAMFPLSGATKRYCMELFKAAQPLNEKKYSEEDVKRAVQQGVLIHYQVSKDALLKDDLKGIEGKEIQSRIGSYLQSLSQSKLVEVKCEMESVPHEQMDDFPTLNILRPKITNNSIKILKVL